MLEITHIIADSGNKYSTKIEIENRARMGSIWGGENQTLDFAKNVREKRLYSRGKRCYNKIRNKTKTLTFLKGDP